MKKSHVHPPPEELVEYRAGTLPPASEQEIRAHLVACQECRELLLELAALEASPPPAAGDEISEFELEAAWREQKGRLFPRQRPALARFGGWAVAAGLLAVVGILGFEVRELRRAAAGIYDADLPRVIAEERGERSLVGGLPVLEHAPGQPGLVLLLLRDNLPFSSFRAEFFSEDERPLLVRSELSGQENLLVIQVPPDALPEGKILVTVAGRRDHSYEPIEEYSFRVRHP